MKMEEQTILKDIPTDDQGSPESIVNTNSILEKIANLYAEQLMSDIILVVGGVEYPAHRVILCASSEVFQVMLMNPEWNECRKRIIELYEEPYCAAVFPQFLKYLYVGQMKATLQSVMPVLALADKYNVEDLVEQCIAFMLSHTAKAATQGYLVSWLQYATSYNPLHKDLTDALKRFLKWNLELVGASNDFVELDTQIMILLLQQNDIVVKNEYVLFGILQKWLLHRKDMLDSDENMEQEEKDLVFRQLIESTVSHIRFAMMSPTHLSVLSLYPIIAFHKEYIVGRISIGLSYHSGCHEERINEVRKSKWGYLQFTPRLYLNDTSSVSFSIKDIFQVPDYNNYVACFFSPRNLAEREDDHTVAWEVEFFPRGVKYDKAKMVWGEELPEFSLRTVRLRLTCRENCLLEERFKVAVLIYSMQHDIPYVLTVLERTEYFSEHSRVLNIDNLLPYDDVKRETVRSNPHLTGPQKNNVNIQVIIAPMGPYTSREAPPFEFNQ